MPVWKSVESQSAIARRRHQLGLSGQRIATLLGMPWYVYGKLERGQRAASPAELTAINDILDSTERAQIRAANRARRAIETAARS
jgi:transcriptional regulator with XRE-family HTH domain